MITIAELEKEWGAPVEQWTGNCYGLACAAAKLIEGAIPIYGHYLGEVAEGTFFEPTSGGGFVQHGWVQLKDGQVLDPTRWAFEGKEPYLYHCPNDVYDEGGNQLRAAMMGDPPGFDPDEDIVHITQAMLNGDAWTFIEKLFKLEHAYLDDLCEPGDVTRHQLFWLANYDPRMMRGHATAIYAMLKKMDLRGLVPHDNWQMVERSPM